MSKIPGKNRRRRRGLEVALLVVVVALVVHFVRVRQVAEEAQRRAADQQAIENLSEESRDFLNIVSKGFVMGLKHPYDTREVRKIRAQEVVATHHLEKEPDSIHWLHNRASARWDLGKFEEAVADYSAILELEPNDYTALNGRSYYYRELGDYEVAIKDILTALDTNPQDPNMLNNYAWSLANLGQFEQALPQILKADKYEPDDEHILDTLGYIYVGLGESEKAIDAYSRALEKDPRILHSIRGRAVAYRMAGLLAESQADLDAGKAIDPDFCLHWKLDKDPGSHADAEFVLTN